MFSTYTLEAWRKTTRIGPTHGTSEVKYKKRTKYSLIIDINKESIEDICLFLYKVFLSHLYSCVFYSSFVYFSK